MKRWWVLLLGMLLLGGCDNQGEETNAGLLGQVLDAETGSGLSGVEVSLTGITPPGAASNVVGLTTVTGSEGTYRLDLRLVGQATIALRFSKAGYGSETAQVELLPNSYIEVNLVDLVPVGD